MKAHADDYADFRCSIDEYLRRYYVGHYNPVGNQFQSFAIKDKLVALLDPKPAAYAKT